MNAVLGFTLGYSSSWRVALVATAFLPVNILTLILQNKVRRGLMIHDDKIDAEALSILSESSINTKTIFSYNMQETVV